MPKLLVIHGPNLNMLGKREVSIYGNLTLEDINTNITNHVANGSFKNNTEVECFQSNAEHDIIEKIHHSYNQIDFIVINPAAFTHTSVAIRDALLAVSIPFVEVHLSNVYKREAFRKHSYFSDQAIAVISGLGDKGYYYAVDFALSYINNTKD